MDNKDNGGSINLFDFREIYKMKLKCYSCGKPVSTEVPDGTIVRAYIECPECIDSDPIKPDERPSGINAAFPCKKCGEIDLAGFPEHICTGLKPEEHK